MENKNIEKLSDEKLEQVAGGLVTNQEGWIYLYRFKYRQKINRLHNSSTTTTNDRLLLDWLRNELDSIYFDNRLNLLNKLTRIKEELSFSKIDEYNASSAIVTEVYNILDGIRREANSCDPDPVISH